MEGKNPLVSMRIAMATDPRDWSKNETDAWLYGIVVGWGVGYPRRAVQDPWMGPQGRRSSKKDAQ